MLLHPIQRNATALLVPFALQILDQGTPTGMQHLFHSLRALFPHGNVFPDIQKCAGLEEGFG